VHYHVRLLVMHWVDTVKCRKFLKGWFERHVGGASPMKLGSPEAGGGCNSTLCGLVDTELWVDDVASDCLIERVFTMTLK